MRTLRKTVGGCVFYRSVQISCNRDSFKPPYSSQDSQTRNHRHFRYPKSYYLSRVVASTPLQTSSLSVQLRSLPGLCQQTSRAPASQGHSSQRKCRRHLRSRQVKASKSFKHHFHSIGFFLPNLSRQQKKSSKSLTWSVAFTPDNTKLHLFIMPDPTCIVYLSASTQVLGRTRLPRVPRLKTEYSLWLDLTQGLLLFLSSLPEKILATVADKKCT